MILRILLRTFVLYILVALIIVVCVNSKRANLYRVDTLSGFAGYPIKFALGEAASDVNSWKSSVRFYKLLEGGLPIAGRGQEMQAYCLYNLGDYKFSEIYYKKALVSSPDRIWLVYNLGVLAYRQGLYEKALGYFKNVINADYEQQLKGALLSNLGKLDETKRNNMFHMIEQFVVALHQQSEGFVQAITSSVKIDNHQALTPVLHPWSSIIQSGREISFN